MTVQVIAEWGQSHGGSLDAAKRQALATKAAGCAYVKYQVFDPARLASRHASRYWNPQLGGEVSQLATFTANGNLTDTEWHELARYCRDVANVRFLATPFDFEAIDLLEDIGVDAYKIASGDLTHLPLIRRIAATRKPVILSTGAAIAWEILQALEAIGHGNVILLACDLVYPCPPEQANLARIPFLAKNFSWATGMAGYSDHTVGVETGLAAAALGARVLEKHCTLTRGGTNVASGVPDDRMALNPTQMKEYVRLAQLGATMRGSPSLHPSPAEAPARVGARRSIYAVRNLPAGHPIAAEDLAYLRPCPQGSLTPADDHLVLGRALARDVAQGDMIRSDAIL